MKYILLAIIPAVLLALSACNNSYIPDDAREEVNVAIVTDDLLLSFNQLHELDYGEVRSLNLFSETNNLIFWATMPITDFAVLLVGYEHIAQEPTYIDGIRTTALDTIYIPIDRFGMVSEMQPGDAFVINNIGIRSPFDFGMPGVTFVDESGTQRYFLFYNDRTSVAQVNPFRLVEFQNRMYQLPEDWQPRWIRMRHEPTTNVNAPSSPERIAVSLEKTGISEYGWQVAANFLSEMTSIFTGVIEAEAGRDNDWEETGRFILGYDLSTGRFITTSEVPEIYYVLYEWGIRGVYDRQRNVIQDVVWAWEWSGVIRAYAWSFKLIDFDSTGIPEILISFWPIFDGIDTGGMSWYEIFRYVDGEYRKLEQRFPGGVSVAYQGISPWPLSPGHDFFIDETGRIVTLFHDVKDGNFTGYQQLVITDDYFVLYPLAIKENDDWDAWWEHIRELGSPTIFGTDIQLAPFYLFDDLISDLFRYLQYKRLRHTGFCQNTQ